MQQHDMTTRPRLDTLPELARDSRVGYYRVVGDWKTEGASKAYVVEHTVFGRSAVLVFSASPREEHFAWWLGILAQLDHPNILHLLECGDLNGTPYAVIEHVQGTTLGELQAGGVETDLAGLLRLFRSVALALDHCHQRHVVHRDVKATNIRIDRTGVPFLTGFLVATNTSDVKGNDIRGGTPSRIAPEAWDTLLRVDHVSPDPVAFAPAVDVWAFGMTLFHSLTGMEAYGRELRADTLDELRAAVQAPTPVDLAPIHAALPDAVAAFVGRCVDKDPATRFTDGSALVEGLDALIDHVDRTIGEFTDAAPVVGRNLLLYEEPVREEATGLYRCVRVEGLLGSGTYADVFAISGWWEGRSGANPAGSLALKLLRSEHLDSEAVLVRFRHEARFLASLSNPHVVGLRGFGRFGSTFFLAMEHLRGPTLRHWMQSHPACSVVAAIRIVSKIALGLEAMHECGLIHRDLKPENVVLCSPDARPVIADFGLVHAVDGTRITSPDAFCGTIAYAAPEQLIGQPCTASVDLYALGTIFYELMCGVRPHASETAHGVIHAVLHDPPSPISQHRPDLDPSVVRLVMKNLDRDPERRFPSVTAFRQALEGLPVDHDTQFEL